MVDFDNGRCLFSQKLDQPLGQIAPGPVLARAGLREHLHRQDFPVSQVNTQPLKAGGRRLDAGIIDADVAKK
jgi:hypothetical protein